MRSNKCGSRRLFLRVLEDDGNRLRTRKVNWLNRNLRSFEEEEEGLRSTAEYGMCVRMYFGGAERDERRRQVMTAAEARHKDAHMKDLFEEQEDFRTGQNVLTIHEAQGLHGFGWMYSAVQDERTCFVVLLSSYSDPTVNTTSLKSMTKTVNMIVDVWQSPEHIRMNFSVCSTFTKH